MKSSPAVPHLPTGAKFKSVIVEGFEPAIHLVNVILAVQINFESNPMLNIHIFKHSLLRDTSHDNLR